jgi:hypothetical protein
MAIYVFLMRPVWRVFVFRLNVLETVTALLAIIVRATGVLKVVVVVVVVNVVAVFRTALLLVQHAIP